MINAILAMLARHELVEECISIVTEAASIHQDCCGNTGCTRASHVSECWATTHAPLRL